jgi:hypothetical protein
MITLRIVNWPEDTGLTHVSTSWQISDKTDFVNILDEVTESEDFINVYRTNLVIPIGVEYFGRSKRHFEGGGSTEWIGPIKILSNLSGDNIDIKPEVYIEEPSVNIIDDVINSKYILKSGSFRCKDDGHKSTSWILKDGLGKVLFRSMYDATNKKEVSIDKSLLNNNTNVLIAEVAHVSTNNYESHFGSFRLELNKFNFEVISNTNFISINEDFVFRFKILNNTYLLTKYEIKDDAGNLIQSNVFNNNEERIIVEREKLKPNTTYFINIYSDSLPDDVNVTTFYTNYNESIYKIDEKYKYVEEYIETSMVGNEFKTCMVEQLVDNGIPLLSTNNNLLNLFHYNVRNESITISDLASDFINVDEYNPIGVNVKVINNNEILIDTFDESNVPVFKVYDYTYGKLIKTLIRDDEEVNTINTNNSTIGLDNKVYYFADVNNEIVLRCYDIKTNTILTLNKRPNIVDLNANLVYIGNDRILSFNGSIDKHLVYLYDISTDVWYEVSIVPERYRNLTMTSFLRKDGKVISFNTGNDTNDVLVFNPKDNSLEIVPNSLDDTIDLNSTVRLRNGEFLRYDSRQINPKIYVYR